MTTAAAPRLSIQDVLRLAGKHQRAGNGFVARCPAHDDNRASLSIGPLDNGGVGLHCHAGCSLESIAGAFGIESYQLSPERSVFPQLNGDYSPIVATYDYVDEGGDLLFQAVRREGKQFAQRRPVTFPGGPGDGRDGWVYKLGDVRRVPYRLPELIEGISLGRTVFICEGEKDCDNLYVQGFTATTNSGGAGKWRDDYGSFFQGANVVILPDNDQPGRKHAESVERSLIGIAAKVRVLALPGLSEKGDVSDWLAAGKTREQLEKLANAALAESTRDGLPLPIAASNVTEDEVIDFHTADFLIRGDIGLIVGEDGTMKTVTALHILAAAAAGGKIFGHFQVTRPQPGLIVSAEDSAAIITNRLRAICRGHGWAEERVLPMIYILAMNGEDIGEEKWRAHLVTFIQEKNIGTVVLDPMRDLTRGEENSSTDMAPFIATWRTLSAANGAVTLLVHHASKGADRSKTDRIRGSGAIRGASRRTIFIENHPEQDALRVESVKFSRMSNPKPFMIRRYITTAETNHATWVSARFEYTTLREAELDQAGKFVRDLLQGGIEMNSSEIREAARFKKVSNERIAAAMKSLEMQRKITATEGTNNQRIWKWTGELKPAGEARQAEPEQGDLLPESELKLAGRPRQPRQAESPESNDGS